MKMSCLLQVPMESSAKKPGNTQENIQSRWSDEFCTPQPPTLGMERQETDGSRRNFFIYTARGSLPVLLERDEPGGVGGTDAGPAVLHRLVRDGKLAQVVADHLGLQEERPVLGTAPGGTGTSLPIPIPILALAGAWHSRFFQLGSSHSALRGSPSSAPPGRGDSRATEAFVPFQVGFNARQEQEMAFNPTAGIK